MLPKVDGRAGSCLSEVCVPSEKVPFLVLYSTQPPELSADTCCPQVILFGALIVDVQYNANCHNKRADLGDSKTTRVP
ncbi:hypothetical protein H671_2g4532 [Cricetulus griseus]|nr:hypothetical protein H671_2g4532 [Cricetulus griseus]